MPRLRFFWWWNALSIQYAPLNHSRKKKNPYGVQYFSYGAFLSSITWEGQVRGYLFLWLMQLFFPLREAVQSGLCIIHRYNTIIIVARGKLEGIVWSWQEGSRFIISKLWIAYGFIYWKKETMISLIISVGNFQIILKCVGLWRYWVLYNKCFTWDFFDLTSYNQGCCWFFSYI